MRVLTACACTTLATLGLLAHLVANDPKVVTLKVYPSVSVRDVEDVIVQLHIQSDPTNAQVIVLLDSAEYGRSSDIPLRGESSPASFQVPYPRVPAGNYTITAVLFRHDGKTWEAGRAVQRLTIGTP